MKKNFFKKHQNPNWSYYSNEAIASEELGGVEVTKIGTSNLASKKRKPHWHHRGGDISSITITKYKTDKYKVMVGKRRISNSLKENSGSVEVFRRKKGFYW